MLFLRRKFHQCNSGFASVETLITAILSNAAKQETSYNYEETTGSSETPFTPSLLTGAEALKNELEVIKFSRTCKVCLKEAATVVFLPCGHIACCVACSAGSATCPLCKITVSESIRSYYA